MNCTKVREAFTELLDSRTTATAHLDARTHLANCPDCQREFSSLSQTLAALDAMPAPLPTPRLRQNFYAMLEEEKNSAASIQVAAARERRARRLSLFSWILSPVAAVALLVFGYLAGQKSAPVPVSTSTPAPEVTAMRKELKDLRDQMGKMTAVVAYGMMQQQQQGPANDRLREVLAAAKAENPSDKTLGELVGALAFDPSVNVRLSALESLFKHSDRDVVRAGVRGALPREQNALVQLEMIDFIAAAHDANATPVLKQLAQNEAIETSVREAARSALAQF